MHMVGTHCSSNDIRLTILMQILDSFIFLLQSLVYSIHQNNFLLELYKTVCRFVVAAVVLVVAIVLFKSLFSFRIHMI